jgi:BirA family biotin operon repressor/biotin-[acetyl-CoA-carboxylase] ligase
VNCREEWQLATRRLGRRVLVFDRLESTNSFVASLANDPANDGVAVLAEEQTSGRGQHGRQWLSPAGANVLLSLLLFPPPPLRPPALLTAWAAVSVCEAIREATGLRAKIKWPNDVLIHGRKVCGILIEQARGTVVGIGLNVNQSAESLSEAGLPDAGSLAAFTGKRLDCSEVARLVIRQLDEEYDRLRAGDLASLEACWKWRLGLLGRTVAVECYDQTRRGRLRDLTWAGLELELPNGQVLRLRPETVEHVYPA